MPKLLLLLSVLFVAKDILAQQNQSTESLSTQDESSFYKGIGLTYMSFFDGPGLLTDDHSVTPNALGKPSDDGLVFNNNLSLKFLMNSDYALDLQARTQYVMNNGAQTENFDSFRWQSPRFGISTTFFKTQNSKLTGAFNTDLPYSFPKPIGGGYIAERRTTIATPGFFAKYSWTPTYSRWSLFSLVQPRFYIYKDRHVAEKQYSRAGYAPELKNELTLSFSPSANYAFTDTFGFRVGTEIIYKKLVGSNWNITKGTAKSADPNSKYWRIQPMPIQTGVTYSFSKMLEISTFIQGYPFSNQRTDKNGRQATFEKTVSTGAWLSGTLF